MKKEFGVLMTAMVTPFDKEEKVNFNEVEKLANYLLQNGTDTLLLTGSTGEAAQLSAEEKWHILKCVRATTPKETPLMVATSDTNTERAISKTNKAFELGADVALVAVPEYIKPPQAALMRHFDKIANAIGGMPMMIYNIPGRTGTEILPKTVAELAKKDKNIIGIKQSMGDMDKVSEMKMLCPPDFQIYSGDDSLTLPMLALGAKGVISVASHLEGNLIHQMIDSFKQQNHTQAQQLHTLLFPLYKALFMTTNPMPVKEALTQRGLISSPVLRTMGEMSEEQKQAMHRHLMTFKKAKYFHNLKQQEALKGKNQR